VVERPGSRRIKLNNHYGLGGTASTGDERMRTHLPLLLHPRPRNVAHLGLGTGISAGAVWHHPAVEQLTVVELVPEVVQAARGFFAEANQGVLTHRSTRIVKDDARHHLRTSGIKYDVIIGDLVVPWRQGEGALYTLEHFRAAKDALAPAGLFCQWVPLFQVSDVEFQILARTFLSVFPNVEVWRGDFSPTQPALALIGGVAESSVGEIESRVAAMRIDPHNGHLRHRGAVLMYRVGWLGAADLRTEETRINSEDRPWLELIGPREHAGHRADNLFVGQAFQRWAEEMQKRALVPAGSIGSDAAGWMRAGSVFARMLLALEEGAEGGAVAAQHELRELLSRELYAEFFPSDGR
jgi:spermidine synthase